MADWILEYSPEIDKKVEKAVSEVLGEKVVSIQRLEGENNYVYKAGTENRLVLVRVVAKQKHQSSTNKLVWITEQLQKKNIPHAKVIYSDMSDRFFKFGFMIIEWVEGENGMALIKSSKLSRDEAVRRIAKILKRIHLIKVDGFGEFNAKGLGKYQSWKESFFDFLEEREYKKAIDEKKFEDDIDKKAVVLMEQLIDSLHYEPESVLTHRDTTPENAIFTNEGQIALVDWDFAIGSTWIEDLAWITFWMKEESRDWFLEAYEPEEPLDLIKKVEKIIHIRLAVTSVPYYIYSTQNYSAAEEMIRRLKVLLSS